MPEFFFSKFFYISDRPSSRSICKVLHVFVLHPAGCIYAPVLEVSCNLVIHALGTEDCICPCPDYVIRHFKEGCIFLLHKIFDIAYSADLELGFVCCLCSLHRSINESDIRVYDLQRGFFIKSNLVDHNAFHEFGVFNKPANIFRKDDMFKVGFSVLMNCKNCVHTDFCNQIAVFFRSFAGNGCPGSFNEQLPFSCRDCQLLKNLNSFLRCKPVTFNDYRRVDTLFNKTFRFFQQGTGEHNSACCPVSCRIFQRLGNFHNHLGCRMLDVHVM